MTITLIVLATFILYRLCAGRPIANVLAAVLVTGLFAVLDPSLRDLPIMAYITAGLVIWAGFQLVFPAAEAPIRFCWYGDIPALQVGRLAVAMVPAGAMA